ncbi:TPA: hypothetical protein DDW35_05690 [Candidatus Sumerlaeota bacterium]|nr:hypothetical protein [Candidatus Sumerlaeota bacterium]
MKPRFGILFIAALFALAFACPVFAASDDKPTSGTVTAAASKEQTTCPIMGGAVNKKLFVDKDGKRIYVCCSGCIEPVKKDFDAIAKKLEASGVTLAKAEPATKDEKTKK